MKSSFDKFRGFRAPQTQLDYLAEGDLLIRAISKVLPSGATLFVKISYFMMLDGHYAKATIRRHIANLTAIVDQEGSTGRIGLDEYTDCLTLLNSECRPKSKGTRGAKRTSAKKVKNPTYVELDLIDQLLKSVGKPDDILIRNCRRLDLI